MDDVQAAVLQLCIETVDDDVKSTPPKLSPVTVTDGPPLDGPFSTPNDATGASNENVAFAVPATAPIVTTAISMGLNNPRDMHVTDELEDHEAVLQNELNSLVAVKSRAPKARPATVTDEPPERAVFCSPAECTGASKE